MPQLYAPDFKRKLDLLTHYAGYKNLSDIAAEISVKPDTLRSWTKDHGVRTEGIISRFGRDPVINLFCAHLSHLPELSVIDLLEGPYDDMAAAFIGQTFKGLGVFIHREAQFNETGLILDLEENSSDAQMFQHLREQALADAKAKTKLLVTMRPDKNLSPTHFVPLGIGFRLEVPLARRAKFFLGLQKSPQGWAAISATPLKGGKTVYVPAGDDDEMPEFMFEDHDIGASRFTIIQSMTPFPGFIYASLQDNIPLSRTDIGLLIRHLQEVPKADRTLHAIDIEFIKLSGENSG